MLTGIDHAVIACEQPDRAAVLVARVGLSASGGGEHPALGTYNRLVWLGDTYLELIGVADPERARSSWLGAPTMRALDFGGGLATLALASDDLASDAARLRRGGSRLGAPIDGERTRPDGSIVRWQLATQPELGPAEPPFLIEHDVSAAEWTPIERGQRAGFVHALGLPLRLSGIELEVLDPDRAATGWERDLGIRLARSATREGARELVLGAQTIRLARATGLTAARAWPTATFVLEPADGRRTATRAIDALGCRFLVPDA